MTNAMEATGKTMRPAKLDEIVWGIDLAPTSDYPLVGGEHFGVTLCEGADVVGITCRVSGALVYVDEATAREAYTMHPPKSMGARGEVRRLRYHPTGWRRFVRADLAN